MNDDYVRSAQRINVGMGQFKKAEFPDILNSGVLEPCIAIGFLAKDQGIGYMLHQPHVEGTQLESQVASIEREIGTLSNLHVAVTGGSLSNRDTDSWLYQYEDRKYVETTLAKYFKTDQLDIRWAGNDSVTKLILDLMRETFHFRSKRIRYY